MGTLQASTSYSLGVPSLSPSPPTRFRRLLFVVRAKVEPSDKSVEIMRKFSEQYARKSGTYFCVDKGVTSVVIKGLAEHKDTLGAPLCPCRHYDDKAAEASQGFWNCPCVPMRERPKYESCIFKEQSISPWDLQDQVPNDKTFGSLLYGSKLGHYEQLEILSRGQKLTKYTQVKEHVIMWTCGLCRFAACV